MIKLTRLEKVVMGQTIDGFMRGQQNFMKAGSEDDINDIIDALDKTVDRFVQGAPTLKDLCIAKVCRILPYTHYEADFEKKLWKAQVIAWRKLHAFEVHGRTIRGIRFLRSIIEEQDEAFLKGFLEFEFTPSFDDVANQAGIQCRVRLCLMMMRRGSDG